MWYSSSQNLAAPVVADALLAAHSDAEEAQVAMIIDLMVTLRDEPTEDARASFLAAFSGKDYLHDPVSCLTMFMQQIKDKSNKIFPEATRV